MRFLKTWANRSVFHYEGSVVVGTQVIYGEGRKIFISAEKYQALLRHFRGRTVNIGTSRDNAPTGSVGAWLQANVTKNATASYVGPILIAEDYAEKGQGAEIIFK